VEQLFLRSRSALRTLDTTYQRPVIQEIDWDDPFIFILGPRGVGKTTLLLQRLAALDLPPTEAIYIDLGDLYFQANHLIDFAESFIEGGGRYLFIDEVHRYGFDSWASELKQLYDLYRNRLKIVVTGSSVVRILNKQADLSRRVLSYRLTGLSFREYLLLGHHIELPRLTFEQIRQHHQELAADLVGRLPPILPLLRQYWKIGYYPYFLERTTAYADRLASSVQTVLEHDLPYATEGAKVDARKIGRLMYAVASSAPFVPNIRKLSERSEISRLSLLRYLELLEDAQLILSLRKDSRGVAALGKPDKLFLANPNLLHALAPQQVNTGTLRETFFLNQLNYLTRKNQLNSPEIRLPGSGDFLLHKDGQSFVFEVGGAGKGFAQLEASDAHYVVADTTSTENPRRIPLWLFGLLY
jgi:predicted AAA+ superfamily ATPase